jgi:hypothetical protein
MSLEHIDKALTELKKGPIVNFEKAHKGPFLRFLPQVQIHPPHQFSVRSKGNCRKVFGLDLFWVGSLLNQISSFDFVESENIYEGGVIRKNGKRAQFNAKLNISEKPGRCDPVDVGVYGAIGKGTRNSREWLVKPNAC